MKFFPWRTDDDVKFDGDDVNESITDALNRIPVPYRETSIDPGTVPMAYIPPPPNPPSRHARPELHITPPQGIRNRPKPPRPSRGRILKASRATLPVFRGTVRQTGWGVFIWPPRGHLTYTEAMLPGPRMTYPQAMQAIDVYTDKSMRRICQAAGQAKAELWERARDFDEREEKLRRPLNMQTEM